MGSNKKKTSQQPKGKSFTSRALSRIGRDLSGLSLLLLGFITILSILTYNHADPISLLSTTRQPSNWAGRIGALLSGALVPTLGFASVLIGAISFNLASRTFRGHTLSQILGSALWSGIAIIMVCIICTLTMGTFHWGAFSLSCGGQIGATLARFLRHYLNAWGALLVASFAMAVTTVYAVPLPLSSLWKATKATSRFLYFQSRDFLKFMIQAIAAEPPALESAGPSTKVIPSSPLIITESKKAVMPPPPPVMSETSDDEEEEEEEIFIEEPASIPTKKIATKAATKTQKSSGVSGIGALEGNWRLPSLEFLKEAPQVDRQLNREDLISNSKNLEAKLAEFGIKGQVVAVRPGPVITMYEFKPGAGVKISQIASRADDLSLALEAQSVRIVAPIPGKSVVGIELPNENRETVYLRELLGTEDFQSSNHAIPLVVGKDIAGGAVITDIAATPHLLVAGSSGAGKSVFINTLITSLLYKFTPQDLRLIMVDPKQLELALYEKIPHLLLPVVDDPQKASTALRWACNEMERRYTLMARAGVRNLKGFNQKLAGEGQDKMRDLLCPLNEDGTAAPSNVSHLLDHDEKGIPKVEHLPFILVIIDEFADLMMVAKKDIETNVARLAAKARASGIHLVIATQRPSTDVITGVIKNNLPSRVGFKVPSQIDSRTILDAVGAEKLLGRGDMLFIPPGVSRLVRVHGAYIDEDEIGKICNFWRTQGEPVYKEEILDEPDEVSEFDDDSDGPADPLYQQAISLVREEGMASASRLQRRFKIGYNRAARMIEAMEQQGLVGPGAGSKPREVIY